MNAPGSARPKLTRIAYEKARFLQELAYEKASFRKLLSMSIPRKIEPSDFLIYQPDCCTDSRHRHLPWEHVGKKWCWEAAPGWLVDIEYCPFCGVSLDGVTAHHKTYEAPKFLGAVP